MWTTSKYTWNRVRDRVRSFRSDTRGGSVVFFALTLIPAMLAIGVAVDYARGLSVKEKLWSAIDAAALAAAASTEFSEQDIIDQAQAFFDANYPAGAGGATVSITVSVGEELITISGTGQIDSTFLQLIGIDKVDVSADVEVTRKSRNVELVMVLDNTGSMSWNGKIDALKSAATTLSDIMFDGATGDDTKIGLVPFAAAVNIGSNYLNSGWIDTGAQSAVASEDFQAGTNVLTLYDQITNRSWNGCVRARVAPYDTSDAVPSGGTPATLWAPYFAPDEPDFSWYANRYRNDGSYGGSYYDYDARQRYTGKYPGSLSSWEDDGPHFNCELPAVTPMTNVKTVIDGAIDAMVSSGSTVIPAGLGWGWRLISPTEPFTEGVSYDDDDTIKAIVLLTDGQNSVGGGLSNHNGSYYNAYGFAQSGHLGSTSGSQAEATLDNKTTTLCNNIKAEGVLIYAVTFQLSDGPTKDVMRNCATQTSMYFDSPSNEQLTLVFKEIAKGLSELRISK